MRSFLRIALLVLVTYPVVHPRASGQETLPPPNVVLFAADGFGVGAWTIARAWAQTRGRELVVDDPEEIGFLSVEARDGIVTDSAAAASAWSIGALVDRKSVAGGFESSAPLLFERLRETGRPHGVVTNARITHATPAPFYARADVRYQENEIAGQLVEHAPTVAVGGGLRHFLPEERGGRRRDGSDLLEVARARGTEVVLEWRTPLPADRPVLALLGSSHLPHEVERGDEPHLSELVGAALDRLEVEGEPWFLLVEEARIDHAGHDMDGPGLAFNTVRMDETLEMLLSRLDLERTLLVLVSDHETANPTFLEVAHPESLSVMNASIEVIEKRIFEGEPWQGTPRSLRAKALPVLDELAAQTHLDPETVDRLLTAENVYDRRAAIGKMVSRRFGISFTPYEEHLAADVTNGHTGDLVPARAWGHRASEVRGVRDHAALGRWITDVLQLD